MSPRHQPKTPAGKPSRIRREIRTIEAMLRIYCQHHHGTSSLCKDCEQLRAYAVRRISHCRFSPEKPACSECPIHCFKRDYQEQIRKVMRFAGPRMSYRHPILAFHHFRDKFRLRDRKQGAVLPRK